MMSPTSPLIPGTTIAVIFLPLMSGCKYAQTQESAVDPTVAPQISSFSPSGPNQASLVLEKTRELRITKKGRLTRQVIPSAADGDVFESATMLDAWRGWAINQEGDVSVRRKYSGSLRKRWTSFFNEGWRGNMENKFSL
jgi:hypothetical protein